MNISLQTVYDEMQKEVKKHFDIAAAYARAASAIADAISKDSGIDVLHPELDELAARLIEYRTKPAKP